MLLNCDLGESYGAWKMGNDEQLMAHVDQVSVACGFHAGDPLVMQRTIGLAKEHKVSIGAHPAYPDLQGFGRRSMTMSKSEVVAMLHYQIAALEGMAHCQGMSVDYVKPHGALYNDMLVNRSVLLAVFEAIRSYHRPIPLIVQASADWQQHQRLADECGVSLLFEAFADRCYQNDGRLLSRRQSGAVLNNKDILVQVERLLTQGQIKTVSGDLLNLKADTLCVHGDNPEAVAAIENIRNLIHKKAVGNF